MTKKQKLDRWREARVQNYMDTRSPQSLAGMIVELEDAGEHEPEFGLDEEWPIGVKQFKSW